VTTANAALDGIVLAAGQSQRMGRPKALLEVGAETFLEHALRVMREGGCRTLTLVLACEDGRIEGIARAHDARVLFNPDPESEQFVSIQLAVSSLPEDSIAAAILPVDCPLVTAAAIEALGRAAAQSRRPIVLPMYNGVGGHPVVVCRSYYEELLAARPAEGMRSLIIERGHQVEIVNLADPGVLIDIDTQQEYDRFIVNPE
jgi:CTP:molybdopterin cytidylyltransferase MocA